MLPKDYARESSDNPILNAFCRVAPSDRFNFLAILAAGVFFFAIVFSSRTWTDVQARLFVPFFMRIKSPCMSAGACSWMFVKRKAPRTGVAAADQFPLPSEAEVI